MVKSIHVVQEDHWSEQRPKEIRVFLERKKEKFRKTKIERNNWRRLRLADVHRNYQDILRSAEVPEQSLRTKLAVTMKRAAKKACDLKVTRRKSNQLLEGREVEAF